MKKLLSILLTLTMMISLVAAFSTVSFAEETTTEISRTEFTNDEWDATKEGFSLDMYEAESRSRLGQPDNNGKWDKEAIEWLTKNGYAGYDDDGARYYLTKNENGGYDISKTVDSTKPAYMIIGAGARMSLLTKNYAQGGECIIGGNWLGAALDSHRINKFPYDFDIYLGQKSATHSVSGVRMYESHYGNSQQQGSYVKDYTVFVKFAGDNEYTEIVSGTNDKKQLVEVNFGYNVEVTDVRIRVNKCNSSSYYTSGGFTVLKPVDGMDTYTSDAERKKALAGKMIDTRVIGSLENKKTIAAAKEKYGEAAVETYKSAYNAKAVKELDVAFGTVTAESPHKKGDGSNSSQWDGTPSKYSAKNGRLTDGIISPDDMVENKGGSYYIGLDYAVYPNHTTPQYITMTLPIEEGEPFTGIRFYNRKSHAYNYYQLNNAAKKAEVTLYDENDVVVMTGTLTYTVGAEHGIVNDDGGKTLKISKDCNGKEYTLVNDKGEYNYAQYNGDIRYVDFNLSFNGNNEVRVSDAKKIVIVIKELHRGNHWGSEEVRLIDDSGVKTTKTVAEIKNDLIKADNQVAITTVETGEMKQGTEGENGIINIITKFNKLVDPSKVEYFGTYAIGFNESGNTNPSATDITADNGNVGVYKVSEIERDKLNEGATYSVQVTGIKKDWYSVPVYAISFVKVEGLDELIFSTSTKIESIDTKNQYDK